MNFSALNGMANCAVHPQYIDRAGFPAGTYFVRAVGDEVSETTTVTIQI